jgi:hypothetical protein
MPRWFTDYTNAIAMYKLTLYMMRSSLKDNAATVAAEDDTVDASAGDCVVAQAATTGSAALFAVDGTTTF